MTMQSPSPRAAIVAYKGPGSQVTQAERNAMGSLIAACVEPVAPDAPPAPAPAWHSEDAVYALLHVAVADRASWFSLETALAGRADPEAALALAEGIANGAPEGQPALQSLGVEADILALFAAHELTATNARRERTRALSRVITSRETPSAVFAALIAAVNALPAAE